MTHVDSGPGALALPGLDIRLDPAPPDLGLGPVVDGGTEWPDVHGNAAARTAVHASGASVELVGLARYALRDGYQVASAWPEPGRLPGPVTDGYHRLAAPLLMTYRGAQHLHASAVVTSVGVVALCATSGTGKSTTAAALERHGFSLWADDAVVFATGTESESPLSVRLPTALRLDETASQLIATLSAPGMAPGRAVTGDLLPLAGVILLERGDAGETTTASLSSGVALAGLLRHALCFTPRQPSTQRRLAEDYLSVVASVPVLRVTFGPDRERFKALISELLAAMPD